MTKVSTLIRQMAKEGHKLQSLERASVLAASDDPKDQDKAREIKTRFDYESLKRQIGSKKKPDKPAVKEAAGAGGGVPMTPQELEIQKKMSRLSMRLARKRNQNIQKAKIKDTETDPAQPKDEVKEARVDKGRSDYGKATIRNWRHSGPSTVEPAMFDPENKRGKTIEKRREEHKARRGVKGAKVPTYKKEEVEIDEGKKKGLWDRIHAKRERIKAGSGEKKAKPGDKDYPKTLNVEGAAWTKKAGKNPEGGLNEKGRKSYERENPGSDLKAPQPEGGSRKKSFCARMGGMKKKLTSKKTANDPDSRINKALRKWNCSYEPEGTPIMEEDKAFNTVVAALRKKHGKDAVITKDSPKPKPPSEAQKKKSAAERKKRQDADNKAYAARAKKAGFKSTQDYTNVVARYGSEDNYRKGKGLGT